MSKAEQFGQHIDCKINVFRRAADAAAYERIVIHSGNSAGIFRDDLHLPFKANAYFNEWLPLTDRENCFIVIDLSDRPALYIQAVQDFWHTAASELPDFIYDQFNVIEYNSIQDHKSVLNVTAKTAYIGEESSRPEVFSHADINPNTVLDYIDYYRAWKTDYEQSCLWEANKLAVIGHRAAETAFRNGCSEYEIHMAYLAAMCVREEELPYGNIIALNENAAVLHHMHLNKQRPDESRSLLIDAGVDYKGYAADISRTYTTGDSYYFEELITRLNGIQQQIVQEIKPGVGYLDIHIIAYKKVSKLLCDFEILQCTVEQAVEQQITNAFFPHGIGHLLGIQVHDRGGQLKSPAGDILSPPVEHPYLRCTRIIEENMVFTIEPGVYFIEALLKPWQGSQLINWPLVRLLSPFGGIRIEDNVIAKQSGVVNLTRNAFQEV